MTRPAWHPVPDARVRAWVERAAGPGWRVVRATRLRGGIAMATDALDLLGPGDRTLRLVVRRWLRPGWEAEDPGSTAAHEATVLERLAGTDVPVPVLVAVDADGGATGAPAVLMRHVAGRRPSMVEERAAGRIAAMAGILVRIHALDAGLRWVVGSYRPYYGLDEVRLPARSPKPWLWARALEVAATTPPSGGAGGAGGARFLHRDFHPGNTIWASGRLAAVVDWTGASWGPPATDLAHWRANLGTRHGVAVADLATAAYVRAAGVAPPDQPWWDVRVLLDYLDDPDGLDRAALAGHERYLEALLERI